MIAPCPTAETIEWLCGVFACESPGFYDDLVPRMAVLQSAG